MSLGTSAVRTVPRLDMATATSTDATARSGGVSSPRSSTPLDARSVHVDAFAAEPVAKGGGDTVGGSRPLGSLRTGRATLLS